LFGSLRSSVEQVCSRAMVFCSRGYKLVREGVRPKSLRIGVRFAAIQPCNGCPHLPFIDARGGATRGKKIRVTVLVTEMSSRASLSARAH
jgi:hypothetical protein